MRILMEVDVRSGPWSYVVELTRALEGRDVEVDLAVFGSLAPERRAAVAGLSHVKLHEHDSAPVTLADVSGTGERLLELESSLSPHVVHLNDFVHGGLPFQAPVLAVAHSCALSRWTAHDCGRAAERDEMRARVRRAVIAADLVVAPTEAMSMALERHFDGFASGRVIPHGIRPRTVGKHKQSFALCAGEADAPHASGLVAAAAQKISWPMFVAGERSAELESYGEDSNVHAVGNLDTPAMERWYQGASIYCLPARCEPFGLTALEAAMRGCALVLGDIESLREVWAESAVYHVPDDPDALAAAVQHLIDSPIERQLLGSAARVRAFDFGADRMAARYAEAYAALACRERGLPAVTPRLAEAI